MRKGNLLEGNQNKIQTVNICIKGANKDNDLYNISVSSGVTEKSDCLKRLGVTIAY